MPRKSEIPWDRYVTEEQIVSVWIGNFPSADACREYFAMRPNPQDEDSETCQFWQDLRVRHTDPDVTDCSGYIGEPIAVSELLAGEFSYLASFRPALLAACKKAGIKQANYMIFLHEFEFPAAAKFNSPYLKFMGAFPYSIDD